MSVIIKSMKLPQHAAVNGDKDTAYKCVILAHPDNSVELVIDSKFASPYDNGHNIQRYHIIEIPEAVKVVSAAAKYRIAQKPEPESRYRGYKCPVCGAICMERPANYCYDCGQALDWSD